MRHETFFAGRSAARAMLLACLVLSGGCAAEFGDTQAVAAAAREKAMPHWKLAIDWEGHTIEYPLERMDIYLFDTDDPERWPETFEIRGEGVTLVGTLPVPAQVGYGEELQNLVGRTVPIASQGGNPHEQRYSSVRLAGVPAHVSGGSITFQKVTGKWAGSDGDRTVWGTVEIQIETASGAEILKGAFAAHVVSWG